ncbi:MAG: asparagine synthetase B family protein [bacterium]
MTKQAMAQAFRPADVKESEVDSSILTIVADDYLCKVVSDANGCSLVESPLRSSPDCGDVAFSQVRFDRSERQLSIFKPTLSGRPIYYHINSNGDFFCSTHISLLRKAGVVIEENPDVLPEFFVYRHVMPPRTLYRNIEQLYSGGRLCVQIATDRCRIRSVGCYEIPGENADIRSLSDAARQIYDRLVASLEKLTPCKDEVAALLSGGIDSTTLCRICQDRLGIQASYSTEYPFEEPELNMERRYALSAGKALGTNHLHYETTTPDYLVGFLKAVALAEEPVHHLQSPCMHLLFHGGIPQEKRIVIQGLGAGGAFGNFRNYLYMMGKPVFRLLSKKPLRVLLKVISKATGRGKGYVHGLEQCASKYPLSDPGNPLWSWHDLYGSKKWACDYFQVTEKDIIIGRYNSMAKFEQGSIQDVASLYSLLGDEAVTLGINVKIAEGNKRILYSPFYDSTVLDYVFSIPWRWKLKGPENALRKEMARQGKVPEFILARPKSGFGIRTRHWAERGGTFEPLVPLAAKVVEERRIRETQSADIAMAMTFWNILNYSIWKRLCIASEPLEVLLGELREAMSRSPKEERIAEFSG